MGPETEAQTAARLGLDIPYAHPDLAGRCPGSAPYGHGMSLTVVHGGCCEAWSQARSEAAAPVPETRREAVAATYRELHTAQQAYAAGRQQLSRDAAGAARLAELREAAGVAGAAHAAAVADYEAEAG
jgi:microcystin-dependent protein